jgi:hypothetical protein
VFHGFQQATNFKVTPHSSRLTVAAAEFLRYILISFNNLWNFLQAKAADSEVYNTSMSGFLSSQLQEEKNSE